MTDQFKSFIDQKLGLWDKIEANEEARAILVQTFSLGGTVEDAAELLSKSGQRVTHAAVHARLAEFPGDRKAVYVHMLQERPVSKEITEKHYERILQHLKQADHARTQLWRFSDDTRAIAVYLLKNGETPAHVARAVSRHLGLVPRITNTVIERTIERAGGRDALIEQLIVGYPPYNKPLTSEDLERGKVIGSQLLDVAKSRLHEKADWMKHEDSRAFVLSLLADEDAAIHMIPWALHKKFGVKVNASAIYRRIEKTEGNTVEEKRKKFVETRRIGIDDALYGKMTALAKEAQVEYFAYLRDIAVRASELGQIAKTRAAEQPERSAYDPLQKLITALRTRSAKLAETVPSSSVTLRYIVTPGTLQPIPTVFVGINVGDNPDNARRFFTYVRDELREIRAGYPGALRDALMPRGDSRPMSRVMLRGPRSEDFEIFSFDPTKEPTRQ